MIAGQFRKLYWAFKRRKYAGNLKEFAQLIKTPLVLAGSPQSITMPGPARVAVMADNPFSSGTVTLAGASIIGTAANIVSRGPWVSEGHPLVFTSSASNVFHLYVLDEWQRKYMIATVTV